MAINLDKPERWPEDVIISVRLYNAWYRSFAPEAYKKVRVQIEEDVARALSATSNLRSLAGSAIVSSPDCILSSLRMCTAPPLAVDRLVGLAQTRKSVVAALEEGRRPRLSASELADEAAKIAEVINDMLDPDLFPWVEEDREPARHEVDRTLAVVSDRLCASISNPAIRNEQETRQLTVLSDWLEASGYERRQLESGALIAEMPAGTYAWRTNVPAGEDGTVNVPVDLVIQPHPVLPSGIPVLIEAKSAGDFTNVNKRRKEEAQKVRQLRQMYGDDVAYILFLGGFFDVGYLAYEAKVGIDWVWEHRVEDLAELVPSIDE
jgi:hypothetical protein